MSNNGSFATVAPVATGSATTHIAVDQTADTFDVPVTVSLPLETFIKYNGTWKGDANLTPKAVLRLLASGSNPLCAGSRPNYGETIVIDVVATGVGTMTMTDAADFDRAYRGTITPNLTFSSSGTFPFLGANIPGTLAVTINSTSKLTFEETTTYGSCSNTYGGTLTKQ